MKTVRAEILLSEIVLVVCIAGCGSSSSRTSHPHSATAVVIARTATNTGGTLPFTQLSAADKRFAASLEARCRAMASGVKRLPKPETLSDQASFSDREMQLLKRIRTAVTLRPPGDLASALRSYRTALLRAIAVDGLVADAARAQYAEAVAYWLSKRAASVDAMKKSVALLGTSACLP